MTATQHLARAQKLLAGINRSDTWADAAEITSMALEAIGNALCAVALELGVPPVTPPAGGDDSGQQQ